MTVNPIIKIIRAKMLGVLIRDARLKSGKEVEECAQAMGISADELLAMEFGERPPTLPELELFAYDLGIPLEHFLGRDILSQNGGEKSIDPAQVSHIRQGMIGELIQRGRSEAHLSIEEMAEKAGIGSEDLRAYEQGERPVPLPELEILAQAMNNSLDYFEDEQGPIGSWFSEEKLVHEFHNLPAELKEFISKPINRPYLEIAVRLSELKVEKLRALGEGLLDITL
jgi:transcriptional regulator with XRE-family HTH domain